MKPVSFAARMLAAFLMLSPLAASADPVVLGDLSLSDGLIRAMPPHAPVAGGFVTIANRGSTDDRLVSVSSPAAGEVQIHEMTMDGAVMKMRALPDGLPIPAGQTVALKPGGYHLMFLKVREPFVEGQSIPTRFVFERAGAVEIPLAVGPANAAPGGHGAPHGDAHSGH